MRQRGWSHCDIILISGDAYIDHPSFGTAIIGRILEAEGYKVGIIAQPDWRNDSDFLKLGTPRLFLVLQQEILILWYPIIQLIERYADRMPTD